jgi:hypothetical protein
MGLFSKKDGKGVNIVMEPQIIAGLKKELEKQGKDVARFEIAGFG